MFPAKMMWNIVQDLIVIFLESSNLDIVVKTTLVQNAGINGEILKIIHFLKEFRWKQNKLLNGKMASEARFTKVFSQRDAQDVRSQFEKMVDACIWPVKNVNMNFVGCVNKNIKVID